MPCGLSPDQCRSDHVAPRLDGAEADGPDFEARCPACGHGGFRVSRPITRMRNVWTCNCKICNGRKGCPTRATRAAMIRRKIPPWCLGSYIGKDKPEADSDRLLKIAQTVDDVINACPVLSAAEIVMVLADARGDRIPDDYKGCAKFAKDLGMSHGNAYNVAAKWTAGSSSRPPDSEVPPQTGGGSRGLQSYHAEAEPCQTPRSEAQNRPKVGSGNSKSWTETALDEAPDVPTFGKQTSDDKPVKPAA